MEQQQHQRIEALELNEELRKSSLKVRLSDPNFDKPLSELTINYEII